jgi:MSHA pilin protein MshD
MSVIIALIVPTEQQSADQIHQIKASELGQSLLEEIIGRAFDQQSDMAGSHWRCNETGRNACTTQANFGPDAGETSRSLYNDVDDYNGFNQLIGATDANLDSGYNSFKINVSVVYDGISLGLANNQAKRITVTITTPLKTDISFTGFKANF